MFGLFRPRCPLDVREKTWVELRMKWLVARLGAGRVQSVEVITPTERHFPDPFAGQEEELEQIFRRTCDWVGVPRDHVELQLFDSDNPSPDVAGNLSTLLGLYQQREDSAGRHIVWIERSQAADPTHFIATAAHELAHCILLGDELLTVSDADHEFVTDLLPVVCGLGIFTANAGVAEQTHNYGRWAWQSVAKQGYLPLRMHGYALAVFAWLREEHNPAWGRHLRGDARGVFDSGLRYLRKTNACRCPPLHELAADRALACSACIGSDDGGEFLEALWELRKPNRTEPIPAEWAAIVAGLDRRDPVLVSESALTIAALHRPDPAVVAKGLELLRTHHDNADLRSAVALALGVQQDRIPAVVDELTRLLEDDSKRVVKAALSALKAIGPAAEADAMIPILRVFRKGLIDSNGSLLLHVVDALNAVCESPRKQVARFFKEDEELQKIAHATMRGEIDQSKVTTAGLPTPGSLPVPLPDWSQPMF